MSQPLRINKFIAERIGLSRREADLAIESGKVLINDKPATIGVKIDKNDKVCYNGKVVPFQAHFSYLMLNKSVGYVCSRHAQGEAPTIYELLPAKYHNLKTVGRLDKDSSGLILLTNDGDFAFHMTHPKFVKSKHYEVRLDKPLRLSDRQKIEEGIELTDGVSHLELQKRDDAGREWQVTMHEGRNRQIRRTFAALGYAVVKLHRTAFGAYQLKNLASRKYIEVNKII